MERIGRYATIAGLAWIGIFIINRALGAVGLDNFKTSA